MATKDVSWILDTLKPLYGDGAFPGRSAEGLSPKWQNDPFHVLMATILSQRTRDENTRRASDALFSEYPDVDSLASADPERVIVLVRPAGFPRQKAAALVECCKIIRDEWDGKVPTKTKDLLKLPMVGRKTAACVRAYAMNIPSVCVDTHVHRISNLLGLVDTKDPAVTEETLMEITPRERWIDINRYFVRHGQEICLPRKPKCERCPISMCCDHFSTLA